MQKEESRPVTTLPAVGEADSGEIGSSHNQKNLTPNKTHAINIPELCLFTLKKNAYYAISTRSVLRR